MFQLKFQKLSNSEYKILIWILFHSLKLLFNFTAGKTENLVHFFAFFLQFYKKRLIDRRQAKWQ